MVLQSIYATSGVYHPLMCEEGQYGRVVQQRLAYISNSPGRMALHVFRFAADKDSPLVKQRHQLPAWL
jgi:hypothetical protein